MPVYVILHIPSGEYVRGQLVLTNLTEYKKFNEVITYNEYRNRRFINFYLPEVEPNVPIFKVDNKEIIQDILTDPTHELLINIAMDLYPTKSIDSLLPFISVSEFACMEYFSNE